MIFLMPLYFIIVCVVIYKLMKKYKGQHKWRRFFMLAFLFYLPVGWDVILGRAYFHYLCNKDGGIHIYETVELGSEHWNEDGSPKFYTGKWPFDNTILGGKYVFERPDDRYTTNRVFNIVKYTGAIIDTVTKRVMGDWITYEYFGGWAMNTGTPFGRSSSQCHSFSDTPDNPISVDASNPTHKKFIGYIFLRESVNQGEKQ